MWETWAYTSSRMCKFFDANVRLALTDTDSLYGVCEAFRGDLSHSEIYKLRNNPIPYEKSLHGFNMATAYIKTFGNILDYSSLDPEVILTLDYNTTKKKRET